MYLSVKENPRCAQSSRITNCSSFCAAGAASFQNLRSKRYSLLLGLVVEEDGVLEELLPSVEAAGFSLELPSDLAPSLAPSAEAFIAPPFLA